MNERSLDNASGLGGGVPGLDSDLKYGTKGGTGYGTKYDTK